MQQDLGRVVLSPEEWRRIREDHKCIEDGQRYVLRFEDGVARILTVTLAEGGGPMAGSRRRPRASRCSRERV
ncbi:MAG: hypothetical protein ACT4QB_16780 [Gammaproteobacteria bacterium]